MSVVDIVVVNWNAGKQLLELVLSISCHHYGFVSSVIIVDNASSDDSIDQLLTIENIPFKMHIVRNPDNRGFGAACNQGALLATSELLLFLNPDTKLFHDSLSKPINFMQQPNNSDIGICGIRLVDEDGNTSTSAARFPTLRVMEGKILGLTNLFPSIFPAHLIASSELKESVIVDQIMGAFFLIRNSVFDKCGGFDESFFVYFEEVDLSLRAKKIGYSSYFLAEASAFHKGGGCSERVKAARLFYSLRSRIQYAQKHYSIIEFIALLFLTGIELPIRLILATVRHSWSDLKNTFSAYLLLASYFIRRTLWD